MKPGGDLLGQSAQQLMGECIRRALEEGDRTALRLCVERVSPTRRGVALSFKLPAIRSAQDVERAVLKVTEALHGGQCTIAEASEVMKFLQAHTRLLEDLQMESRLGELERRIEERDAHNAFAVRGERSGRV